MFLTHTQGTRMLLAWGPDFEKHGRNSLEVRTTVIGRGPLSQLRPCLRPGGDISTDVSTEG